MKKNILAPLFIIAAVCTVPVYFPSCKKLIEIPDSPPNKIGEAALFADSINTINAIGSVYNSASGTTPGFAYRDGALTIFVGTSADELGLTTTTNNITQPAFYYNSLISTNGAVGSLWSYTYASLYQVNACITNIKASPGLSASFKQQLLGEMQVVRALYYFNLVNLFGGVPLATTTDYTINALLPRASVDAVYELIINDLTDAREKLKPQYPASNRWRPNLYTADALLAKVYLYREEWQKAYDLANEVIRSGVYSLVDDRTAAFRRDNSEAIWQLPANGSYYAGREGAQFYTTPGYTPIYPVNMNLVDAFEANDERRAWVTSSTVVSGSVSTTYYIPYKYRNLVATASPVEDFTIFRLAEMYLIRAEAANELETGDPIDDVNEIRLKAGLEASTASTKEDIQKAIIRERRIEMCFEWGNRWFDLKRWGIANDVLAVAKQNWNKEDKPLIYPIPYAELMANPKLVQTPGYPQ